LCSYSTSDEFIHQQKVISIYRLNSALIIFCILFPLTLLAEGAQDLATFCFESNVALSNVQNSLKILILPRDIVELRAEDNCIDIVTTPDRANLFEKYLSKRYSLKRDAKPSLNEVGKQCLIEFKTTNKIKRQEDQLNLGTKNAIKSGESESSQVSSMDLLLGDGVPGELSAGPYHLAITCRLIGDKASLAFSFADKDRESVKTEVLLKRMNGSISPR